MSRPQNLILLTLLLTAVAVAAAFLGRRQTDDASRALAVGLRGTTTVTQPLSDLQKSRLDQHFLAAPPALPASRGVSGLPETVSQAQAINRFNQGQRP